MRCRVVSAHRAVDKTCVSFNPRADFEPLRLAEIGSGLRDSDDTKDTSDAYKC